MSDKTDTKPAPQKKVIDPSELLQIGLSIIKADLKALAKKTDRDSADMLAVSRYTKDLHAISKVNEETALAIQKDLAKLSSDDLARMVRADLDKMVSAGVGLAKKPGS